MTPTLSGNPIHLKCAVCGVEFGDEELFTSWDYENIFFLFKKRYPVHWKCAKKKNIPKLKKLADKDSIDNLMAIRANAFEVDLEYR